jgi:predicted ATP-grasp superfamily ATP-dependent carboligase
MSSSEHPSGQTGRSSPTATPAVVVGLDSITGLQTARILAARSVPVHGVVADRRHWGARTNACATVVESPLSGSELAASLALLGRRLGRPSVLLPCSDAAVDAVSRHRDRLAEHGFLIALPEHHVVELLMDKVQFARYAAEHDLPVPRTEHLAGPSDATAVAASIRYPCVLKPPYKTASWLAHTSAKAFTVPDERSFLETYDRVRSWVPFLLAQEWIPGGEDELYSCNAVFAAGGEPLATFVARKLRQWPPDIGTSASGEECRNDEVLETTVKLFSGLAYRGLAYLEMKRDARTGELWIVEPNVGRPTGRSAIAEAGGVELVMTAYCDAAGLPLPRARQQHYGDAKWVDLRRDLQAAMVARRRGTLTLREWLSWVRGPKAHAIWSRRDPAPFVVDVTRAVGTGARLVGRRRPDTSRTLDGQRRTTVAPPIEEGVSA